MDFSPGCISSTSPVERAGVDAQAARNAAQTNIRAKFASFERDFIRVSIIRFICLSMLPLPVLGASFFSATLP